LPHRLFHEDGVRVFDVVPLTFSCRCSAERVTSVLKQYPVTELQGLAEADGLIRATCEFCSTVYAFAPDSLGWAFGGAVLAARRVLSP
jgi:molecular chaperone Hsp33